MLVHKEHVQVRSIDKQPLKAICTCLFIAQSYTAFLDDYLRT